MTFQISHRGSATYYDCSVDRICPFPADDLYRAWTDHFDQWFALPDSIRMRAEQGEPFFFETRSEARRHPHYGRFIKVIPGHFLELTWITGEGGTEGVETVLAIELTAESSDETHLHLTHRGFATEAARDRHRDSWPMVLDQLERHLS